MTTYNTGNALGSAAVKDIYDNAQNLDHFVNDLDSIEWADRFGVMRKTWSGMEKEFTAQMESQENRFVVQLGSQAKRFNTFIQNSGYQVIGDYTDGPLTITDYNQLIRFNGELYKLTAATDIPWTATGNDDTSWAVDSLHLVSVGDAVLRQELTGTDGLKMVGQCPDIITLRLTEPEADGQRIFLQEYAIGTGKGGGTFIFHESDTTSADDGGFCIVTEGGKRWKRDCTPEMLNVEHYGALMDGVTDDMPAVMRMYYGTVAIATGFPVGVRFPAGKVALSSTFDISDETEQPMFRVRGPDVEYGAQPATRVYFTDTTSTTPVFQVNARRMEMSGLHLVADDTVTPFYKNACAAGQYIRVKSFRCNGNGGLVFDVQDIIDTKLDQIYCYSLSGGFLNSGWSNTVAGGWDHSTAIEISNANFTSCKTVDVLKMIRATQCLMRNVWFSSNEYTFDVSQGGWLFDTVIVEGSTYPAKTKYAKLQEINCRYEQGATKDSTLSGYTSDMDNGGSIPSWVTNAYDQGGFSLNATGNRFNAGVAARFHYPTTILENSNNAETWFYVGRLSIPALGRTAQVRFAGASGWDSASGNVTHPGATNFGSGEAKVFLEMKQPNVETTSVVEAHWHGEANCPVTDVGIVHNWQYIFLYVKVAQYARYVGVFMETNALPRADTSSPFYFTESNTQIADISTVENLVTAKPRWTINRGRYDGNGFGMDLDSGDLLLYSGNLQAVAAGKYISVYINGEQQYIPYTEHTGSVLLPRYAYADLPSPATHVYCMVMCTDTALTPAVQPLFSNGLNWYPVSDPAASWAPS